MSSTVLADGLIADAVTPRVGDVVRLAGAQCRSCQRVEFPVRSSCPSCGQPMEPRALAPNARVHAVTQVEHPPPGALVEVPYVVVMADLPEGVTVLGQLVGAGFDEVAPGDEITSVAVPVGDKVSYGFRLGPV
jgi:uncharacterized OB-fold protein